MAVCPRIRCVTCGLHGNLKRFGLSESGDFAPVQANEPELRIDHIGGRGRLRVERVPLPLHLARGLRENLRAALARLDAEIEAAEGGS